MADYKTMYYRLFTAQAKAIELLKEAQRDTEQYFINENEPIRLAEYTHSQKDGTDATDRHTV